MDNSHLIDSAGGAGRAPELEEFRRGQVHVDRDDDVVIAQEIVDFRDRMGRFPPRLHPWPKGKIEGVKVERPREQLADQTVPRQVADAFNRLIARLRISWLSVRQLIRAHA